VNLSFRVYACTPKSKRPPTWEALIRRFSNLANWLCSHAPAPAQVDVTPLGEEPRKQEGLNSTLRLHGQSIAECPASCNRQFFFGMTPAHNTPAATCCLTVRSYSGVRFSTMARRAPACHRRGAGEPGFPGKYGPHDDGIDAAAWGRDSRPGSHSCDDSLSWPPARPRCAVSRRVRLFDIVVAGRPAARACSLGSSCLTFTQARTFTAAQRRVRLLREATIPTK
jgi:hypothetical protein